MIALLIYIGFGAAVQPFIAICEWHAYRRRRLARGLPIRGSVWDHYTHSAVLFSIVFWPVSLLISLIRVCQ